MLPQNGLDGAPAGDLIAVQQNAHEKRFGLLTGEVIGAFADRLVLETNPAVQACQRMGLPVNYLYCD